MKAQTRKFLKKSKLLPLTLAAAVGLTAISVPFFAFSSAGDKAVSPTDSVSSSDVLPSDNNAGGIMALSTEVASGTCGTGVTWTLDDAGLLTISGSGAMDNYSTLSSVPWNSYRSQITSAVIDSGVASIGDRAFSGCSGLTSVTIPDSVTSIYGGAFQNCSGLTSVTIGNSVTSIGDYAFYNCSSLTSINVDENNSEYASENGVLFNKIKSLLISYPGGKTGEYIIPDSVTSIGEWAFVYCDGLTSLTIGNSVTSIGDYAFQGCRGLTDIYYKGSETQWQSVSGYSNATAGNSATVHFICYSDETHDWQWEHDETSHRQVCSICGEERENSAGAHSFTNYVSNNNATCTEDGTETADCDNGCGVKDTRTEVGSKLGHNFVNGQCTVCRKLQNNSPGTGDSFNPVVWIVLMILSASAAIAVIMIFKRKKQQNQDVSKN